MPKINQNKAVTVMSWTLAVIVLGTLILFFPAFTIGLFIGYGFGIYGDKLTAWEEKDSILKDDKDIDNL